MSVDESAGVLCEVCGNELQPGTRDCPYCGSRQEAEVVAPPGYRHKTVNLELGRPLVEAALKRLDIELAAACHEGVRVLTLIHGYGSSGSGGAIRIEARKLLQLLGEQGKVVQVIPGEEFRVKSGPTRDLLRRFPQLATHPDLNHGNRGVTLVVL